MAVTILNSVQQSASLFSSIAVSAGSNRKLYLVAIDLDSVDAGGPFSPTIGGVTRTNAVQATAAGLDIDIRLLEWNEAAIASMSGSTVSGDESYGAYHFWWSVQGADQSAAFAPATSGVTASSGSVSLPRAANSMTFAVGGFDANQAFTTSANPAFSINHVSAAAGYAYGQQVDTANTSNFTWSTSISRDAAFALINVAPAADSPTISDIDTDESVYPGQSVTGTGTNITNATGFDIGSVSQADFTVVNDTSFTFTGVRGGNPYNTDLIGTLLHPTASATITVQQEAEPGTFVVTASSPNTTDDASLWSGLIDTATGDPVTVVDGDQAWVKSGPAGVAVEPSGRITANETGPLIVQFWKASEGVWGSNQTVSFTLPAEATDNWPFGKAISPIATKNWTWGSRHPMTGMRVRIFK